MVSQDNVRNMKTLSALKAVAKNRGIKGISKYRKATMNNLRRRILNNMNNNRGMGGKVVRHPANAPKTPPVWMIPRQKRPKTINNAKRQMLTTFLSSTNYLRNYMNNTRNYENGSINNIKNNNKRIKEFAEYHTNNFYGRGGAPIILENSGVKNFNGNMNNARAIIKEAMNHGLVGKNFRLTNKGANFLNNNSLRVNERFA